MMNLSFCSFSQIRLINKQRDFNFLLVVFISMAILSCKPTYYSSTNKGVSANKTVINNTKTKKFSTGAENFTGYFSIIEGKRIGIVTNQSGLLNYDSIAPSIDKNNLSATSVSPKKTIHIVDYLVSKGINLQKIYAPEHGFRGTADAGEHVIDGRDLKTSLPIISLYGENRKPKPNQLEGIDVMLFDLQDVGARFYTYISTLHYIMEACAENNILVIVLDRPNPNGAIVDGPILEKEYTSFVGMHPIPILHGMTIGEYAQMINGEKWLNNGIQCDLQVIACSAYTRDMDYSLPVKPSPNLPNSQSINLYASLCLFEGTNVSVGRGTEKQFQLYGSPYLPKGNFSFIPQPNFGAKNPLYNGIECYGEDLSVFPKTSKLEIKWLLKVYGETSDKTQFFNSFFTKLAGTKKLQQQIEEGKSENQIRDSWKIDLQEFKKVRKRYLIY